jgi:predicted PurR-regulated permease PerM
MTVAEPHARLSRDAMRRIADALVAYGIAGLILAGVGLLVLAIAAWRLNTVADRADAESARVQTLLNRTATALDDAVGTVEDVASTLDRADPMIARLADSLTATVAGLGALEDQARSVSILGSQPLGGIADRFGGLATTLTGLDSELRDFGGDLASDADRLRTNVRSLAAVTTSVQALEESLQAGLVTDAMASLRFLLLTLLAFLAAVAALPAIAALWIGRRIRAELRPVVVVEPIPIAIEADPAEPAEVDDAAAAGYPADDLVQAEDPAEDGDRLV